MLQGERSVPLRGFQRAAALGAPLVTFPATGKSPGVEGRSALPMGKSPGVEGRSALPMGVVGDGGPHLGSAEGRSPSH